MLQKINKNTKTGSAILAGIAVLCGGVAYIASHPADNSFISLNNLPSSDAVETFLQTKLGTQSLSARENFIDLPQNLDASLKTPYRISSSIRMPDETYRDFTITVTAGKIDITADGFNPRDTVSLNVNNSGQNWIPADWSGKIELTAALPTKKTSHACIGVDNGGEKVSLCHTIKEGWLS